MNVAVLVLSLLGATATAKRVQVTEMLQQELQALDSQKEHIDSTIAETNESSIVGDWVGSENWPIDHDFVVRLRIVTKTCTGTIVGGLVVTAAHCMASRHRPNGISASDISVQLAQWRQGWVRVKAFKVHPGYPRTQKEEKRRGGKASKKYDIAILWLDDTEVYPNKDTVVFASRGLQTRDTVAIAGFGKTERGSMGVLHDSGPMKVVTCPNWSNWPSTHKCAGSGSSSDRGSCGGDSGGPWYVRKSNKPGKVYIVGVNSFGVGGKCGATSKQTGFTYLGNREIQSWVKKTAPELKFLNV